MYGIAAQYYGHGKYWRDIAKANPDIDPNNIMADMVLVIPDPDVVLGRANAPDPDSPRAVPADGRTYVVKRSDSLYAIAQTQLGAGGRWREIYQMNRDVIGPSPDDLQPGMRIQLPR
jgi:nucleoid-associated protein YgaU